MDFAGKKVLITGGSRGIGLAFANKFLSAGSQVHLVARSFPDTLDDQFHQHAYDLSDTNQIKTLVKELGEVDFLVNNAGLLTGKLLQNLNPEDIVKTIDVNLKAVILLTRYFLPTMMAKKSGWIINNASVSGEFYFPGSQVYSATKAGVVSFTRSLRMELEKTGVNTLLLMTPGVQTKMFDDLQKEYSSFLDVSDIKAITPEQWVDRAFRSMKRGEHTCYPSGYQRVGLFFNRHTPSLFERAMRRSFKPDSSH